MSKFVEKFQEIIVNMHGNKPYYEIKYISSEDGKVHIGYSSYNLKYISEFLRDYFIPTIEYQKHGHWVKSNFPTEKYCCSVCGAGCWYYDYEGDVARSRYCPQCGAKMDEKEVDKI